MAFRSKPEPTPADLHRAPIISEHLIIREALRTDAGRIEETMVASGLTEGDRTADGARRFGAGLHDVPVWSATRAVCEKGTLQIVGGVVLTEVEGDPSGDVRRLGWWLEPAAEHYAGQVVEAVYARLLAMGADRVVMHLHADADVALRTAEDAGFRRGEAIRHTTVSGQELEFWEYSRP